MVEKSSLYAAIAGLARNAVDATTAVAETASSFLASFMDFPPREVFEPKKYWLSMMVSMTVFDDTVGDVGALVFETFRSFFPASRATVDVMDEKRAQRVVDALRERGVPAHLERAGVAQYGVRVALPDGRQAIWDTDGTAGLEAQVMRNGVLVGFVPMIEGSEEFDQQQVIEAIARTDYDQPIARQRRTAPPPAPSLPREGGFFRRLREGFREQ
jgi:hypothetical protein